MKLLVDGYWWNEGPISNRMVTLEIVKHWNVEFPRDRLVVAVPHARKINFEHELPLGVQVVRTRLRAHPAINSLELPLIARRERVDGVLTFSFAAPTKRSAVLLHDVLYQTNPEWFTRIERIYYSFIPILARFAGSVIATSATEQARILDNNPSFHRVVRCGLTMSSRLADARQVEPDLDLVPDSFIACVGRFDVRKNLETTVRALRESGVLTPKFPLVLIGEPSSSPTNTFEFEELLANKSIVIAKRVTDGQLKWIYRHCRLFVCLSLDEGFGLPVVEAATFGAPVLASDIPVFRETLQDYGEYVAPTDTAAIASSVRALLRKGRQKKKYTAAHDWQSIVSCIRSEFTR